MFEARRGEPRLPQHHDRGRVAGRPGKDRRQPVWHAWRGRAQMGLVSRRRPETVGQREGFAILADRQTPPGGRSLAATFWRCTHRAGSGAGRLDQQKGGGTQWFRHLLAIGGVGEAGARGRGGGR